MGDQSAPTFKKKPAIRQEDDGERLLFECIILGNPTPAISWFRDDVPVTAKGKIKIICDRKGNEYHCALVIDDVDEEDGGKYKVTAKNNLGESSATINLNFDTEEEEEEEGKPTFTGKPLIKQVSDSIVFECQLTADPKPSLHWFHNGKPISDGGRYKSLLKPSASGFVATLEIAKVGNADGGEYKVVAKNSVGDGSATINLNFEAEKIPGGKAPRFPKKPAIRQEGDSLCLEVFLEAHPFPKIGWFLGTKEVKEGPRHKIKKKDLSKDTYLLSLEILDPSPEDGGAYRCNAVNELGESNANIALNLQGDEGPTFTQKPKIIPKESGKLIVMECHVKSKSALQVSWFQGNKPVQESIRIKSSVVELRGNEYKVTLEIRDPSSKDGGIYKCNIKNDEGEINANLNLNIEGERIEGDAPTFVEKPKIISEDDGKRIIMECKVKANPKPTITWYLDNVVTKENSRIIQTVKEEKDVYTIRLELRNPELTDAGLYKCNVKNVAGESNANLTLNIELAPVIREKPRVIRRTKEEKVVIECHVKSNAQPECVWFKENSMVKIDTKHKLEIRKVEKGEYAVRLEIEKPSAVDKGLYKLQAKNEKGVIASEPIKVTLEDTKDEEEEKKDKKTLEKKEEKKTLEKKEEQSLKKTTTEKKEEKKEEQSLKKTTTEKKEEKKEEQSLKKTIVEKKDEKKEEQSLKKTTVEKTEEKRETKTNLEKKEDKKETKTTMEQKEEKKEEKRDLKTVSKKEDVTKKTTEKKEETKDTVTKKQLEDKKEMNQIIPEKKEDAVTKKISESKEERKDSLKKEETITKLGLSKKEEEKKTEQKTAVGKTLAEKKALEKTEERKDSVSKLEEKRDSVSKLGLKKEAGKEEEKAPAKRTFRKVPPKEVPPVEDFGKVVLKKRTGNPPKIVKKFESINAEIGQTVEFSCEIESKERVTATWYKNKKVIDEPRLYNITLENKVATISMSKVTVDFNGVYTCEVTNQFGKDETSATLFVQEPGMKMPEMKEIERGKATPLEAMPVFEHDAPEKKSAEVKKTTKKKKKVPGKAVPGEEEDEESPAADKPDVPEIMTEDVSRKGSRAAPVTVVKEATPEPHLRKNSLEPPGGGSRRGSASNLLSFTPPGGSRRGSITLIADEKGLLTDDKGNVKKLRPGEVLEVRQKRKGSADVRRASVSEIEERIDKPSTPLRKIPEEEESAPTIVDFQENVTATEGGTAYLCVQVEGNPTPDFRFYKGDSEIFEGGRYKVVTDGATNSVYFCIRKAKSADEDRYKIVAYNKLGEDSVSISLFVSDESGMDFRAMLKRRQYAKWGKNENDPDWGGLKPGEQERRPSFGDLKKADFFVKKLENQHVKEGRDKKIRFEAVFSRSNVKAKWYKNRQEIYQGKRYQITAQGDLHVLEINHPTMDDEAKYTIQCNEVSSAAILEVDAPEPVYKIIKKLPPKIEQ